MSTGGGTSRTRAGSIARMPSGMTTPKERLRDASAGQDSQFATAQALALGLSYREVEGMRSRGEVEKLRRGVGRFRGAAGPADPAITAVLTCWPEGVISHGSAAQHHGIGRVAPPPQPEITVPHGLVHKIPGVTVHWSRSLPAGDILRVGSVDYTSLARTTIDLADPADPVETLAILDDVMAMGAPRNWVHSRAVEMSNGRGGVTLIREATAKDAAGRFNSWLERTSALVYRAGGLPDPDWNVWVRDARGRIGIVDALWPQWKVVSETEGLRFHTTPSQRRRDAERFNRLLDADFRARRFTWEDITQEPLRVVETLYRALRSAGADLDPARIPRRIDVPRPSLDDIR